MSHGVFLSPAEWQNLGDRLADPFFADLHAKNERALAILAEREFWNVEATLGAGGTRNHWNWRIIKLRLIRATVSWRVTGAALARDMALEAIDRLCDPELWTIQFANAGLRHADLKTADLAFCACFALDALGDLLDAPRGDRLRERAAAGFLSPYVRGCLEGDWWRHCDFNWGAALHGTAGLAALTLRDTHAGLAETALAHVRDGLPFVLDAFPADGGWIEGMMYQTTTLGHLTDFIVASHRLTGDDFGLLSNRRFLANFDYRLRMLGGDDLPLNFSDCSARTTEWRCPHVYWWARQCGRPDWTGFEDAHPRDWRDTNGVFSDVEAFWLREPGQPSTPPDAWAGVAHFRGLDWLSWRRENAWLAFRSGYNGGNRGNWDLGQVIFGVGPDRLLVDPGYEAGASHQHNCVVLRRGEQARGATAKIFRAGEVPGTTALYLACDLTEVQAPLVRYHYRHVLASPTGWVLILDDILSRWGNRTGAIGHLQLPADPTVDGKRFDLNFGGRAWRGYALGDTRFGTATAWEWAEQAIHTLTYQAETDAAATRLAVLLTPFDDESHWEAEGFLGRFAHAGAAFTLDLSEGWCRLNSSHS